MKRIFSIFFLFIFLFNVGGYYLVFLGLRINADHQLAYKLDRDQYSTVDTHVFKIPLTLPYGLNHEGYQRVEGTFEHNGEFYKLVKQKLENDTLHVVCVKDHQQKVLTDTFDNYTRLSNDLPASAQKDGLNLLSKLSKDFESNILIEIVMTDGWFLSKYYADCSATLLKGEKSILSPPPKSLI